MIFHQIATIKQRTLFLKRGSIYNHFPWQTVTAFQYFLTRDFFSEMHGRSSDSCQRFIDLVGISDVIFFPNFSFYSFRRQ